MQNHRSATLWRTTTVHQVYVFLLSVNLAGPKSGFVLVLPGTLVCISLMLKTIVLVLMTWQTNSSWSHVQNAHLGWLNA